MRICLRYSTVTNDANRGRLSNAEAICCPTIIHLQTRGGPHPFGADTTCTSSPRQCPYLSYKKTGLPAPFA